MWDRLLVDCNIATLEAARGDPLGVIENGAIGIADGKIVRVGKRTELAGYRAKKVDALGGAWVTPGLIDCHTHLVFAGNRADEHAMRRAGASYEEIARAGGGIASTVAETKAASDAELLDQSRRRLHALMAGGCTTVEVKSGYALDPAGELRLLGIARQLGEGEAVRIVPTLLALHALPADSKDRRTHYVGEIVDKLIPKAASAGLAAAVDAYCDTIGFTPDEVERLFKAAARHGLGSSSTPSNFPTSTAPSLPRNIARCRPITSSISTRPAPRRWPTPERSPCSCPAPSTRSRKRPGRRSTCSASTRCRSPSPPTATPALRRCSRRPWR